MNPYPNNMGGENILEHMQNHLERLNRDHEEMLTKLNNPDSSLEEKTHANNLIEVIQRQISAVQTRLEFHTKVRSYPM